MLNFGASKPRVKGGPGPPGPPLDPHLLLRDKCDIPEDPDWQTQHTWAVKCYWTVLSSDWLAGRMGANIQLLVKS